MQEVVFTHNFGFRPTGMLREGYVFYLRNLYAQNIAGTGFGADISKLKINEITDWLRAWMFMEMCGFPQGAVPTAEE